MSLAKKQNHAPNKSINPVTSNISSFISAIEFPDTTNIIISVIDIKKHSKYANIQFFLCWWIEFLTAISREPTTNSSTSFVSIFFCVSIFSPRNNSVTVTSNISAIGMSNTTLGILRPRSHLLTVLSDTYNFSAKSFWVKFFSFLNSVTNKPNFSLLIWYIHPPPAHIL